MRIDADLYEQIWRHMPIPCVDVVVRDPAGRVLMVKRGQEPASGMWWFPGGRVLHGETRREAVARKLFEECGLRASTIIELATFDVILPMPHPLPSRHGVTTVFVADVTAAQKVTLDTASTASAWRQVEAWSLEPLHEFVRGVLIHASTNRNQQEESR